MTIFSTFSPSVRSNLAVLFVAGLCFWAGLAGSIADPAPYLLKPWGAAASKLALSWPPLPLG
jgi:hypothetical protein